MMRKKTAVLFLLMALLLNGCGVQQNSVSAVAPAAKEETMQIAQEEMEQPLEQPVQQIEVTELREESEVRAGSSEDTLATPSDFPAAYNYGSGIQSEWGYNGLYRKLPEPEDNQTVFNTAPDPSKIQVLYLWEEGNVPAQTEFTENMTGYYDSYDFRPYVTAIPMREGTPVKGAVVLLAGGAFQVRGNYTDTLPTAAHLRELGFQTFIVDYRLRPYTQQEGALDVARAVRFIRKNADVYGIDPDDIAVMGYSAGGIQTGEFFLNFDGEVNGTALDPDYVPDELDAIPANASAAGMIYSFYGRLSVASMDAQALKAGNLPPPSTATAQRTPSTASLKRSTT